MADDEKAYLPVFIMKYLCSHCEKSEHLDKMINELKEVFQLTDDDVQAYLKQIESKTLEEVFEKGFASIKPTLPPLHPERQEDANMKEKEAPLKPEMLVSEDATLSKELEAKIAEYEKTLQKKNFFAGLQEGTPAYQAKQRQARRFYLKNFTKTPTKPEAKAQAENFKLQGNAAFSEHDFTKACELYTKAIELDMKNTVYFANRAAALSNLDRFADAVTDCYSAILLDPKYVKAITRLGTCYTKLGKTKEAREAFLSALGLEPENQVALDGIKALDESDSATHQTQSGVDFSAMLNNPDTQNALHGILGQNADGITNLLNQPGMQNMMNNVMNNPQMMSMASNIASSLLGGQQGSNAGAAPECNQQ